MAPTSLPERHRRETYDGLELASDPMDRAEEPDFVVGVGSAGRTLARLTIRRPVGAVLDLGTGSGIQALLAARHADRVVGADINPRALAYAEHNAAVNRVENVEWRLGSWLEPVQGERFGLIVANPPYVISPDSSLTYRDSGEPDDALFRRLLREIPAFLEEGGFAHLLGNWVPQDGDWRAPIEEAIAGAGCDVVLLHYAETAPEEYARSWNLLAAQRDHREFDAALERWLGYYRDRRIDSIAFGMVVLRRRSEGRNWVRAIKAPAEPTNGAGVHVERLFRGWDWVRAGGGTDGFALPPGARLVQRLDLDSRKERATLEVRPNAGFAVPVSDAVASALAGEAALPAEELRRLVGLGMLLTPGTRS